MKLYIICNKKTNDIRGISEDKELIYKYIIQNKFSDDFKITIIKDKEQIEKYLIVYDEFILDIIDDLVLTGFERKIINTELLEAKSRIKDVINELSFMVESYNFDSKDLSTIEKTIKVLKKNSKPKRLNILISIKEFIFHLIDSKNKNIIDFFKNEKTQKENMYYIDIKIK